MTGDGIATRGTAKHGGRALTIDCMLAPRVGRV